MNADWQVHELKLQYGKFDSEQQEIDWILN